MFRQLWFVMLFSLWACALAVAQPPIPKGTRPTPILLGPEPIRPLSHQPKSGEEELEDFRAWLTGGKRKSPFKDLDPEVLKQLMEQLPKDQKSDPKQIEEMLKKNKQFQDPEFLKQLEKMLQSKDFPKNIEQKFPKDGQPEQLQNPMDLHEKLQQVIEAGKKGGPNIDPKEMTGPKADGQDPKLPTEGSDPNAPKNLAGENEWVKWLQKNFGDSPAAEGAAKDLVDALNKKDGKGLFDDIPEFKNGGWKDLDQWGKSNAGELWKMKPPDMQGSGVTPPKVGGLSGGGGPTLSGGGGGGGGGPSLGGGGGLGGGGTALAIIAGIVGAIFLVFLLLRKWKLDRLQRAAGVIDGATSIDFDSIQSREELVRVFNRVSLDRCGEDARPWNHRVVADHFGQTQPAHAQPANDVAGLYERARYAPADEDLTAREFADARRDLRTIAGVTP
jgi:hypothetical protein